MKMPTCNHASHLSRVHTPLISRYLAAVLLLCVSPQRSSSRCASFPLARSHPSLLACVFPQICVPPGDRVIIFIIHHNELQTVQSVALDLLRSLLGDPRAFGLEAIAAAPGWLWRLSLAPCQRVAHYTPSRTIRALEARLALEARRT